VVDLKELFGTVFVRRRLGDVIVNDSERSQPQRRLNAITSLQTSRTGTLDQEQKVLLQKHLDNLRWHMGQMMTSVEYYATP
jgi:hypothetical protein